MRSNKLIQLYITNMCNSHCKTCSIWKNKKRQELSLDNIKSIVEPFKDSADFVIGGGEAILHSDIENILSYLQKEKVNYTLLSNCILYGELKRLILKYQIPNITISCDGINHDEIRGSVGNKTKIIDFISWAKENGVNFKISYTYSSFNEDNFIKDMDWLKSLGIDKVYFCLAQNMDLLETGTDDVVAKDVSKILFRKEMLFEKDLHFIASLIGKRKKLCDSQDSVFTIYSNGDVVRCQSFMSKDVIGDVNKDSFAKIISNEKAINCPYDKECNLLCQRRYD